MATKSASRTKRPSPVVSKHGGSPSSSISSFSPSMDSTYPPLVGPAPTSPGLQSLYSESMLMDGGGSKESVTVAVRFRPLRFGFFFPCLVLSFKNCSAKVCGLIWYVGELQS